MPIYKIILLIKHFEFFAGFSIRPYKMFPLKIYINCVSFDVITKALKFFCVFQEKNF